MNDPTSTPEGYPLVAVHRPEPLAPHAPAAPVDLYGERQPVVWVPDAYGRMVPLPKHLAPPTPAATPPRDLTPAPLLDPIAQRLLAAGLGGGALAAGVGYGIGQAVSSLTGAGSGALLWLLVIALALRSRDNHSRAGTTVTIRKAVIKRNHFHA